MRVWQKEAQTSPTCFSVSRELGQFASLRSKEASPQTRQSCLALDPSLLAIIADLLNEPALSAFSKRQYRVDGDDCPKARLPHIDPILGVNRESRDCCGSYLDGCRFGLLHCGV